MWRTALHLKSSPANTQLAKTKTDEYMTEVKKHFQDKEGHFLPTDEDTRTLEAAVHECLQFTFDVGPKVKDPAMKDQAMPLYEKGKFGFAPPNKMDPNPGDAFVDAKAVEAYESANWMALSDKGIGSTPAYDLIGALMALYGIEKADPGKVAGFQHLVNAALGTSGDGTSAVLP